MVAEVVVETADTSTLVFFTGNDHLEYRAGHFLTIDPHQFEALERFTAFLEDLKGKREPPRAYSMCSAPHERYLAVTVKEEQYVSGATKYPPLLSPLLVKRTVKGMRLLVTGFTGPYTLSPEAKHPERLRVIHTLTREPDVALCGPSVRKGRLNADVLRELIPDFDSCVIYVCGPGISKFDREAAKEKGEQPQPRFLESVLADLKSLGVPNARIKRESYG